MTPDPTPARRCVCPVEVTSSAAEVFRLQVQAAALVIPLTIDAVELLDDRLVVAADVVATWLALPAEIRARYDTEARSTGTGLEEFTGDYVDVVDDGLEGDSDERRRRWRRHITVTNRRLVAGAPPPRWWLARFPLTMPGG